MNPQPQFYNPFEVKHRRRTSQAQLKVLERTFTENPKPNGSVRRQLAQTLGMTPRGVQVWFQNRRAKAKHQRILAELEQAQRANASSSKAGRGSAGESAPDASATSDKSVEEEEDRGSISQESVGAESVEDAAGSDESANFQSSTVPHYASSSPARHNPSAHPDPSGPSAPSRMPWPSALHESFARSRANSLPDVHHPYNFAPYQIPHLHGWAMNDYAAVTYPYPPQYRPRAYHPSHAHRHHPYDVSPYHQHPDAVDLQQQPQMYHPSQLHLHHQLQQQQQKQLFLEQSAQAVSADGALTSAPQQHPQPLQINTPPAPQPSNAAGPSRNAQPTHINPTARVPPTLPQPSTPTQATMATPAKSATTPTPPRPRHRRQRSRSESELTIAMAAARAVQAHKINLARQHAAGQWHDPYASETPSTPEMLVIEDDDGTFEQQQQQQQHQEWRSPYNIAGSSSATASATYLIPMARRNSCPADFIASFDSLNIPSGDESDEGMGPPGLISTTNPSQPASAPPRSPSILETIMEDVTDGNGEPTSYFQPHRHVLTTPQLLQQQRQPQPQLQHHIVQSPISESPTMEWDASNSLSNSSGSIRNQPVHRPSNESGSGSGSGGSGMDVNAYIFQGQTTTFPTGSPPTQTQFTTAIGTTTRTAHTSHPPTLQRRFSYPVNSFAGQARHVVEGPQVGRVHASRVPVEGWAPGMEAGQGWEAGTYSALGTGGPAGGHAVVGEEKYGTMMEYLEADEDLGSM
ncbi:hypothetical protein HDV00_006494 [Rhizophlyctis rosea]|nr:hypothetical protein HDV00_006494 [Rhizophlyctis rosea]